MNPLKAVNVIFFLFIAGASFSCKSQKATVDTLLISIEKTPCFGTCEAYKMEIFSSGLVALNGISNIKMIGNYQAIIEKQSLTKIQEQFRSADFFSFKSQYTGKVSDLPTTYLFFKDGEKEKMIQDYYQAPAKLKELEKLVENLVETLHWKKVD